MANSLSVDMHRKEDAASGMTVQQDAIQIAACRNAPQSRDAIGVRFDVGHTRRLRGCHMQGLKDVTSSVYVTS